MKYKVLNIDSVRNVDGGWEWNAAYYSGEVELNEEELTPRKLLHMMREKGYLTLDSKGKMAVDLDAGGYIEFYQKGDHKPLFALENCCLEEELSL